MQSFLGLYHLNSDIQELPTAVKEEYLRRAILLMDHHPMVSILERKVSVFFYNDLFPLGGGGSHHRMMSYHRMMRYSTQRTIIIVLLPVHSFPFIIIRTC